MDPVEEYAELKQQITRLQARADQLRDGFLQPGARLRSNQTEIIVRMQVRRLFLKDKLPTDILRNPAYWQQRHSPIVTVRTLETRPAEDDDLQLTEPFALFPPPRFATPHPGAAPG